MAQLLVRNLDAAVVAKLRLRAAAHGRSAEAEHRLILQRALEGQEAGNHERETLKELLLEVPYVPEGLPLVPREGWNREEVQW